MQNVSVNGNSIQVCVQGSGRPLLLVHGFPLDHRMWRFQIEHFSRSMKVIAPDLPGFGASTIENVDAVEMKSYADFLADLIVELQIESAVTFCGLSMGGYVGWQFLKFHPQLVDRVIMCNTRAAADDEATRRGRTLVAGQVLKHGVGEIASHMPGKLLGQKASKELEDELRQTIRHTHPKTIAQGHLGMSLRPDMTPLLSQIQLPSLLIGGSEDAITPSTEMQSIANLMPNAAFVDIQESGHMTPLESPSEFNQIVESFLKRSDR